MQDSGYYLAEAAALLDRGRQQGNRVEGMMALARLAEAHMQLADRLAAREAAGLAPPADVHAPQVLDCHDRRWELDAGSGVYRLNGQLTGVGMTPDGLAGYAGPLRPIGG